MSCEHTKLHVEADPCFGRIWTASCTECADADMVDGGYVSLGPSGSGATRDEAVTAFWSDVADRAEQEMLAAADRMAAKSREVLAAFKRAAQ